MLEQKGDRGRLSDLRDRLMALLPARLRRGVAVVPVVQLSGVIGAVTPLRPGMTLAGLARTLERAFSVKNAKALEANISCHAGRQRVRTRLGKSSVAQAAGEISERNSKDLSSARRDDAKFGQARVVSLGQRRATNLRGTCKGGSPLMQEPKEIGSEAPACRETQRTGKAGERNRLRPGAISSRN